MMMGKLMLCVSVLVLLLALTESSYFCCTQYHENPVSVEILKFYMIQEDTGYCNIRAVM
ncbi:hypothetical protein D4764_15G0006340 [Takifugu flavidus]|uniref:Chemokine interleukin-8-like domain-containing protein n=1 Tax=Takifugu flavidus TaxID=433684 RepID=A0A5C6P4U3_9TELE|nr:hypothetical protein D4764_15G0006340 [Takifugu flavidus]